MKKQHSAITARTFGTACQRASAPQRHLIFFQRRLKIYQFSLAFHWLSYLLIFTFYLFLFIPLNSYSVRIHFIYSPIYSCIHHIHILKLQCHLMRASTPRDVLGPPAGMSFYFLELLPFDKSLLSFANVTGGIKWVNKIATSWGITSNDWDLPTLETWDDAEIKLQKW